MRVVGYVLAAVLSQGLPRGLAYAVGRRVAGRFYATDTVGREAVRDNLRRILSHTRRLVDESTLDAMALETFRLFGQYLVDFFRYKRLTTGQLSKLVTVENLHYLDEALARGRGVLAVTAHLGSWEIGGATLCTLGYPVNGVALPSDDRLTHALFQHFRERRGMRIIEFGRAARGVIRALQRKEIVALLADRDYSAHNDWMEFFGKPARLPSGPARLAASTGADIVPIFMIRQPGDRFLMQIHPPLNPAGTSRVEDLAASIRDVMEKVIACHPCQWFMFQDFWNGRPLTVPQG